MIFYNIRRQRRRENFYSKENAVKKFLLLTQWGGGIPQIFGQWGEASSIPHSTVRAWGCPPPAGAGAGAGAGAPDDP